MLGRSTIFRSGLLSALHTRALTQCRWKHPTADRKYHIPIFSPNFIPFTREALCCTLTHPSPFLHIYVVNCDVSASPLPPVIACRSACRAFVRAGRYCLCYSWLTAGHFCVPDRCAARAGSMARSRKRSCTQQRGVARCALLTPRGQGEGELLQPNGVWAGAVAVRGPAAERVSVHVPRVCLPRGIETHSSLALKIHMRLSVYCAGAVCSCGSAKRLTA